jgi:pimeloyl-ACP methyl ester carboxylesterase
VTEAALAWYRARGEQQPIGPTKVPTLFIWGDADDTVGRAAAEGTGEFIAADYQFAPLPGVGHYASDQVPQQVTSLLLDHLARHPA